MANIKSQIKRIKQAERARVANKGVRSGVKTALKKFEGAVAAGDLEGAETLRREAARTLDKAASKHVIHANKAANHKSAMAVRLAEAIANPPVAEETPKPAKKRAAKGAPAAKKAEAKTVAAVAKPKRVAKKVESKAEAGVEAEAKPVTKKAAAKATATRGKKATDKPEAPEAESDSSADAG